MRSLPELLLTAAERSPDLPIRRVDGPTRTLAGLVDAAARFAGGAADRIRPGDVVTLLVADIDDFFPAFWGTLWLGATPVPVAPPRPGPDVDRVRRILARTRGPVVTDRGFAPPLPLPVLDVGSLDGPPRGPTPGGAPALVQFSSGSTGTPRGVVLGHPQLLANVDQLAALPFAADDVLFVWMPHFHDMGLIGGHLLPLRVGMREVRMDPLAAMRDPVAWLRAASDHQATALSTTNFAMVRANARLATVPSPDLSAVRLVANGAEPISPDACRTFSRLTGIPERAHLFLYGMAEACVGVSGARVPGIHTLTLDRELARLGPLLPGLEGRLVDGELQLRGPNLTTGYLDAPDETAALFDAGWLRTGDEAVAVGDALLHDGPLPPGVEVVITGRRKDVIAVNGRKLHAHDVEAVTEAVPGVREGGAVAFADRTGPGEGLVVAVRLDGRASDDAGLAAGTLRAVFVAVTGATGVEPLVRTLNEVPRTTSGKKRRAAVRLAFEAGRLDGPVLDAALACFPGIDPDMPFAEAGLSSLRAVEALARLGDRLGAVLDHRLLLEAATPRDLAARVERSLASPLPAAPARSSPAGLAIVAVACRLPGADSPEGFWADLAGPSRIRPGPYGVGGWLDDVERFDAEHFRVAAAEAAAMDPQQRLVLTLAAELRETLPLDRDAGVFVAAGQSAYAERLRELTEPPPGALAGNLLALLASRVSHTLDLHGPALTIDTACSGALVALHLAARAIAAGDCPQALVGAVNLNLTDTLHRWMGAAGALSATGRCRPFEPGADGTVPGEGATVFLLEPLARARRDGHPVLAVLRGSAVNNDGSSLGILSPNPAGQEGVIRAALQAAGVEGEAVAFVEAHGTGTPVGDAVERAVLGRVYPKARIGATKAHTGHLMSAAGGVGLLRTIGELTGRWGAPSRLAAVSAFGFGGTNAHVVLEAGDPPVGDGLRTTGYGLRAPGSGHGPRPAPVAAYWLGPPRPSPGETSARPREGGATGRPATAGGAPATAAPASVGSTHRPAGWGGSAARERSGESPATRGPTSGGTAPGADATAAPGPGMPANATASDPDLGPLGGTGSVAYDHGETAISRELSPSPARDPETPDPPVVFTTPYFPGETDVSPGFSRAPARGPETPDPPVVFTTPRTAPAAVAKEHATPASLLWTVTPDPAGGLAFAPAVGARAPLPGARVLITGGTGGIGRALVTTLRGLGAQVVTVARGDADVCGDVADPGLHARLEGPFDLGFHLAGSLADPAHAKVRGWENLRTLAVGRWVLASSIAAVLPGLDRGLEAYADANRALIAAARPGRVAVVSLGPVAEAGMAAGVASQLAERGIPPLSLEEAVGALLDATATAEGHLLALRRKVGTPTVLAADLAPRVRAIVARAAERAEVPDDVPLGVLGIDSVAALDVLKELEDLVGRALPTTLVYEYDTVAKILAALGGAAREAPSPAVTDRILPSQQTFVVQRAFFPDMPGNVLVAVTVTPALERTRLEWAWNAVLDRHPALTAVIRELRQVDGVARPAVRWGPVDEEALASERFDLEHGPLVHLASDGSRVVLDGHHSVVDAWSMKLVLEDLLALYVGDPLPPLRSGYREVARALHGVSADLQPWRARLGDGVAPLHLPWSAAVDAPSSGGVRSLARSLDAPVTAALEARARAAGVTVPALVLAIYVERLYSWSGQPDVTVRVAHARREVRVPDVERVVGAFADTLPVRLVVNGEPIEALARRVAAEIAFASKHAGTSSLALATLAEHGPSGPVGLTPVGFSFPLLPSRTAFTGPHGSFALSAPRGAAGAGMTRLTLAAFVFDGRLHLSWNAARSHLDAPTLASLADDFSAALQAIAEPPPTPPESLSARVLASCRAHPERVYCEDLTYGAWDRRSGALAARLGTPERVAVLCAPGRDAPILLLAVLRSGAAYVPLDPEWPDARIAQIVTSARPDCVVCPSSLAARAQTLGLPVVTFDGAEPEAADGAGETGPERTGPLTWIMYTSGSTGRPKGVVVGQRAALTFLDWAARFLGAGPEDRFVGTSSLGYGGSVRQIFTPALVGGRYCPVPRTIARDPDALLDFLAKERITVWNSVPSMWAHLIEAGERREALDLGALRWVLVGGEAVPTSLVRRWRARFPGRVANLYGSTETIVNATFHEVVRDPADLPSVPIGRARGGTPVQLLDVNDGVGEIVVGGAIADGYWEEPDLTRGAFLETPEGRWYRTGDLGRRLPDGSLVYVGRADGQVQVHGNRVELQEIDAALLSAPGVRAAVTVWVEGDALGRDTGFLVADVEGEPTVDLREWLRSRLPAYMVPHRISVGTIPRNPAGKVDRPRIRREAAARLEAPRPVASGDAARLVSAVWRSVLALPEDPSPEDDFFALGGDSIRTLEVLERLRPSLEQPVAPLELYGTPKLADQAALVAARGVRAEAAREGTPSRPASERRPISQPRTAVTDRARGGQPAQATHEDTSPFPLSTVQRGFWTAHHRRPDAPPTWAARLVLDGPLDLDALDAALTHLVARHPLLRTVFLPGPVQQVRPPFRPRIQLDDFEHLGELASERLEQRFAEELEAGFALDRLPLFRVRVCRLPPGETTRAPAPDSERPASPGAFARPRAAPYDPGETTVSPGLSPAPARGSEHPASPGAFARPRAALILASHHAVSDAWSLWLLADELLTLHDAFVEGREPGLPAIEATFRDVVAAEDPRDDGWWRGALAGLAQQAWRASDGIHTARVRLASDRWERLRERARAAATTPYALVLEALFGALTDVFGPGDRVVSTAYAAREEAWQARIVGPFARGIPVRAREPREVAGALRAALAHAGAGPASIAAGLGADAMERLGRYFLTWLDPTAVRGSGPRHDAPSGVSPGPHSLAIDWSDARFRFSTPATGTEAMVGVLVHDGLRIGLTGGPLVERLASALEARLQGLSEAGTEGRAPAIVADEGSPPHDAERLDERAGAASVGAASWSAAPRRRPLEDARSALLFTAPDGIRVPLDRPTIVERVEARDGVSELVFVPVEADLDAAVAAAARVTDAPVIALAGMLPSRTGLGMRPLTRPEQVLTTGHAATVCAMARTVELALTTRGRRWEDLALGVLGYGNIGRAVLELLIHRFGPPRTVVIEDPLWPGSAPVIDCDLIVAATSVGRVLDVDRLRPGAIVIDDSFPRAFDDARALTRMRTGDVLLVGGGMLDVGPLRRVSPFPAAEAIRAQFPSAWLPGCQAEALLLAAEPGLGPTVGPVTLARSLAVDAALTARGWTVAPLHLGTIRVG